MEHPKMMQVYTTALDAFLERWPIENIKTMTLTEYVSVNNKDTFCYWLESGSTILGEIGSVRGSLKFGIYKRTGEPRYEYAINDDEYTWGRNFGLNRIDAFESIKRNILSIIEYAQKGQFKEIDRIKIENLIKWKIAFIYSNERLIPIYSFSMLSKICGNFGYNVSKNTSISEMQEFLISQKPNIDIYSFQRILCELYKKRVNKEEYIELLRKESDKYKSIEPQFRNVAYSKFVEQKHSILQNKLISELKEIYGDINVKYEKDYVDIKVVLPNIIIFYEIKTKAFASDCIKEALGQVLKYVFNDDEEIIDKKIVVVGQYPPNEKDKKFIDFIKNNLKIAFDYEFVDL